MSRGLMVGLVLGVMVGTAYGQPNLLTNGSLEVGVDVGTHVELPVGSTGISGWLVIVDPIDYIGTMIPASDGNRCVDLNASPSSGGIAQSFATIPGETYNVSFDLTSNEMTGPAARPVRVQIDGGTIYDYSGVCQP
ncbi:MAG: DUF642 domain-containing protein [Phycisphaerae bacterium]|nr:DUF642 domain-containing protein [Phycisphaerae bacterium]